VHEAYVDPFERIEHAASEQTTEAAARDTLTPYSYPYLHPYPYP